MLHLTVYDFSFLISFLLIVCHFHAGTRQRMMAMKFVAALFAGFYFWGVGAQTAMYAVCISGLGGLTQAIFADHVLEKTRLLRLGIAIALASMGIVLSATNSLEALPLVATIISRLSEVQACRQRIRFGYVLSTSCWITYALSSGLMILFITENLNMLSNLLAVWRHEQARKKLVPVAVRSS